VVLYGCETWSLALREEHSVKVFENRVLRKIFGLKRNEVMGEWEKGHNPQILDLYSSPNEIRMIKSRKMRLVHKEHEWRRGTHIGRRWESQRAGRLRQRWEDNINIDLVVI
jgi:hypothetical protein